MVFVAVLLPVLALFVSLAIDFGHFFDYSRNLQNRADAAALAAATQYGATCFGTPTQAQLDAIGHAAQQYSGPPNGTPDANLPYTFASVSNYQNQPNLSAGAPADLHMILNGAASWDKGGTSFSAGSVCSANYAVAPPASPPQPATDVWITQANLPLFFPLLGFKPNISAHARVQLQQAGSPAGVRPIAVPDPGQTPCLYARVFDQNTGNQVGASVKLTKTGASPPTFSAFTGPVAVTTDQLTVQAFLPDDCSAPDGSGTLYDAGAQGGGIVFINTYTPLPGSVSVPTRASVWLTPGGCTDANEASKQDAYFYYFTQSTTCGVTVHAKVAFPSGQGAGGVAAVMDGDLANAKNMTNVGGNEWMTTTSFLFGPRSGRHTFALSWFQSASSNNKCRTFNDATKNNNPCFFDGGNPLQETFAAVDDGSDPPDDSGPVITGQIGCATGSGCPSIGGLGTDGATAGVNTIPAGTNPNLQVTFQLQGLSNSGRTDPPIVLRASVQSSKRTGLVDCGQNGANGDALAITNGCPHSVAIYNGSSCVIDPSLNPWTCLRIVTGNRRQQIMNGFTNRIGNSCDNWQLYKQPNGPAPSAGDPRAFTLIITSPNDLSAATNQPNTNRVHILGFATFYVTGWDGDRWLPGNPQTIPGCASPTDKDEAYPGSGSSNNQIWGHFVKFVDPAGTGTGQPCDPNTFGDCVAALTQ